jgi:hypothetical protein
MQSDSEGEVENQLSPGPLHDRVWFSRRVLAADGAGMRQCRAGGQTLVEVALLFMRPRVLQKSRVLSWAGAIKDANAPPLCPTFSFPLLVSSF